MIMIRDSRTEKLTRTHERDSYNIHIRQAA